MNRRSTGLMTTIRITDKAMRTHDRLIVPLLIGLIWVQVAPAQRFGIQIPSLPSGIGAIRNAVGGAPVTRISNWGGMPSIQRNTIMAFRQRGGQFVNPRPQRMAHPDWTESKKKESDAAPVDVQRHALIIATRDYSAAKSLPSLPGTNRDAELIQRALSGGGFAPEQITLVYDDSPEPNLRPTGENLRREVETFFQKAESGVALIFLIGHGISNKETSYYCAQDVVDAALDDPSELTPGLLSIDNLTKEFSSRCSAENKLIVVDACRDTDENRFAGLVDRLSDLEKPAENVWLISSCSSGQRSWISNAIEPGERHAVFTYYFAEALKGNADVLGDHDGQVGLFEAFSYAFVKTRDAVDSFEKQDGKKVQQTPELFGLALPFELATADRLIARRTLTSADVQAERARTADQIADDMLANLRLAESSYRARVLKVQSTDDFQPIDRGHRTYLSYLLGNRIDTALEIDANCKLAHLARGVTYRGVREYEKALDGFRRGDEDFELFVKAGSQSVARHQSLDQSKKTVLDDDDKLVFDVTTKDKNWRSGSVYAFAEPGSETKYGIPREAKIRITDVRTVDDQQWLRFDAINGAAVVPLWIPDDSVYWLPEAVDVYTPQTSMRPFGASGYSANRIDYAADQLEQVALGLEGPGLALDALAARLSSARAPIANAAYAARQPTRVINDRIWQANRALGYFGVSIPYAPNPVANFLDTAHYYAGYPSYYVGFAASRSRVPAGYVRTAKGFVEMPNRYVHRAQGWSGIAMTVQAGHEEEVRHEEHRLNLERKDELQPIEARPIKLSVLPWERDKEKRKEKKNG